MKSISVNSLPRASSERTEEYDCSICKDREIVLFEAEGNLLAKQCECVPVKKYKRILTKSGISAEFQQKNFKNYTIDTKERKEAFGAAKRYSQEYINNKDDLYSIMFLGQPGAGKTHLAIAIANSLMDQLIPVKYIIYPEMMRQLKAFKNNNDEFNAIINELKNVEVLLVDDLFKFAERGGRVSETDLDVMFELVNHRYFTKKPMIISSEYTTERLYRIDSALGSRLVEMSKGRIVNLVGKHLNWRLRDA